MHFRIMGLLLVLTFITTAAKATESLLQTAMLEDLILRGDYDRAIDSLISLEFAANDHHDRAAAALISARLYELAEKSETSIRLLERFLSRERKHLAVDWIEKIKTEQARLMLSRGEVEAARVLAAEARYQLSAIPSKDDLFTPRFYHAPVVSGLASTLMPGLGQTLQGRPQDALTAWLMIGIPLTLNMQARKNGEHAFANASGILAGFFYLGNIASAYRIAEKEVEQERAKKWSITVDRIIPTTAGEAARSIGLSLSVTRVLVP